MCELKPGCRCAADTRGAVTATLERYTDAHPDGPAVDPLSAAAAQNQPAAAAPVSVADYQRRLDEAQAELEVAERAHKVNADALDALRAERLKHANRAVELRNQIDPHIYAAEQHTRAALERAQELYVEHGANPRLVGYYASDMREAAGLAPSMHDPNWRDDPRRRFIEGRALRMKVKRNGPDAGPTRAAAEAAKTDPKFTQAVEGFNAEKQAALALEAQAQEADAAMRKSDPAWSEALRRAGGTETALGKAQRKAAEAQNGIERAQMRTTAGIPMEGQSRKVDNTLREEIYVAPDGATNLWRYKPATPTRPASYERLYARTSERSGTTHLVTSEGEKVRRSTHYANFRSTTVTPEVWVGKPAKESRPVGEVYEQVRLEVDIDSGD